MFRETFKGKINVLNLCALTENYLLWMDIQETLKPSWYGKEYESHSKSFCSFSLQIFALFVIFPDPDLKAQPNLVSYN